MKSCVKCLILLYCLSFIEATSFRCDYKYNAAANGWFKSYIVPATWHDARLRCALQGAVIASPTTPEIEAEMTHIMSIYLSNVSEIFTGIQSIFTPGEFYTIGGVPLSEISVTWAENEPDNAGYDEYCITLNSNGDIADRPCSITRPYICYRSAVNALEVNTCGTIDPEYRLDARTNKCYKFHTVPRTFNRAAFACGAEGGHLAIVNSETEAKVIRELFAQYPGGKMIGSFWKDVAFIGFHDWGEQGDWRTLHGQTLNEAGYSKFSGGEPNNSTTGEYCGSIYRSGLLNDLWCNNHYAFICEKKPNYPKVCCTETVKPVGSEDEFGPY